MTAYTIGNAVHDERGKSVGGQPGDQLQKNVHDYAGEVKQQAFYKSSKGWKIMRLKSARQAIKARKLMIKACDNVNIGYSQSDRYGIIREGIKTKVPVNCDCTSLVRQVLREATKEDIPDFYSGNEVRVLTSTGLFLPMITYADNTTLYEGDVLVHDGHSAIVTEGMQRKCPFTAPKVNVTSQRIARANNLTTYIKEGEGVKWVQWQLCRVGYQHRIDLFGGIDGQCGDGTVECIETFQSKMGLTVDGICGKKTRRALKNG